MANLRGAAFWTADALAGGRVRAHLNDIADLMDDLDQGARRRRMLDACLCYTTSYVQFYKNLQGATSLRAFPVVNKATIREHSEEMIAEGIDLGRQYVASTSGSTGTPLRIPQDNRRRRRAQAEAIYFGRRAGYQVGVRFYYLKVWSERNHRGRLVQFMRNVVPVDITTMSGDELLSVIDRMVSEERDVAMIAYSSALEAVARAIERSRYRRVDTESSRIRAIIGQSEDLPPDAKAVLFRALGCEPVARYGLEEVGIVAHQVPGSGDAYLVNRASHIVEILQEGSDEPAEPGDVGRIVVTDLFNRAQPMVRYDTGDLGSFLQLDRGLADERWLARIDGRKLDQIYDSADKAVSPLLMYKIWWRFPDVNQYQLIQRGRGDYLVRLNTRHDFGESDDVARELRTLLGVGATISVEITDEPLVYASGKRQSVVSRYKPDAPHDNTQRESGYEG